MTSLHTAELSEEVRTLARRASSPAAGSLCGQKEGTTTKQLSPKSDKRIATGLAITTSRERQVQSEHFN